MHEPRVGSFAADVPVEHLCPLFACDGDIWQIIARPPDACCVLSFGPLLRFDTVLRGAPGYIGHRAHAEVRAAWSDGQVAR